MSMLFVGMITYLSLRWNDRADDPGNEKYMLLIAYLVGLSVGVHLLSLLVIIPFMMIFYFRTYDFTLISFLKFGAAALLIFGIVYPGIVKWLPGLLNGAVTIGGEEYRSFFIGMLPYAVIGGAIYGVYYSHRHQKKYECRADVRTVHYPGILDVHAGDDPGKRTSPDEREQS